MKRTQLLKICRELARKGVWCIPESTLWAAAGYPSIEYLRVAMSRHVKAEVIEKIATGLYENPFCTPPAFAVHRLANFLRPRDSFYLSLETVLSEASWISQIPFCTTFVTTGRSHVFKTKYGPVHFVHTEESTDRWEGHLTYEKERQVWVASPEKAFEDLKRYGKNLDLVEIPEDDEDEWVVA